MQAITFGIVVAAVVALIAWRGIALYDATFHKKGR